MVVVGPQDIQGEAETALFSLERRRQKGDLTVVCSCLMGVGRGDGYRLFSQLHGDKKRQQAQVVTGDILNGCQGKILQTLDQSPERPWTLCPW